MLSQLEFETLVQLLNRTPMSKGELLAVNAILEKLAPTDKPAAESPLGVSAQQPSEPA